VICAASSHIYVLVLFNSTHCIAVINAKFTYDYGKLKEHDNTIMVMFIKSVNKLVPTKLNEALELLAWYVEYDHLRL